MRAESSRRPAVATGDPLRRAGQAHRSGVRLRGSAQLADVELVEGQLEDRVRGSGSCRPFQRRWVVAGPAATEPSLAVKSIVVVKVALPFVSF
jgi:hypothetical protein